MISNQAMNFNSFSWVIIWNDHENSKIQLLVVVIFFKLKQNIKKKR